MKTTYKLAINFMFLLISAFLFAQNARIDSLKTQLPIENSDEKKIELLGDICWEYMLISDFKLALDYGKQSLALAQKLKNDKYIAQSYSDIGSVFYSKGDYQKAIESYSNSLQIRERNKDTLGTGKNYNNLGAVYQRLGDNSKALDCFLKAMRIFEKTNNKAAIHAILNNIGEIYRFKKDYEKALDFYQRSLKIKEELGDKYQIAGTLNNIGMVYGDMKNIKKSLEIYNKTILIQKEIGDKVGEATSLLNMGILYKESGDFKKSLQYYKFSLEISTKTGDKHSMAMTYNVMANLYLDMNNYVLAEENFQKAFQFGKEMRANEIIMKSNQGLAVSNYALKNFQKAYDYHELYAQIKDTIYNQESNKLITEMQTKYETEKKEQQILMLNKDKEAQVIIVAAESKRQKLIIYSVVSILFLVMVFAIFVYWSYLQKRKANLILLQQKEEISTQRDEIEAQRDLVTMQKDHIEKIHKEVTDSINYAKRIQEAVLPYSDSARSILGDHFILFKPKDIVSGDFFWTTQINNFLLIAVADCTGHGVPGAFMSMLGISFLTEIVNKKEITQASHVLDRLRIEIIKSLQQNGTDGEQKDGMDIALLVINKSDNSAQYSGANNSIFVVSSDKKLKEIEPDKMPVSIHDNMKNFTNHEIQLNKGDCIYLASDGFEDQFGGPKNKKFMAKQLKELLVNISDKPTSEQCAILNQSFENWINYDGQQFEQIDDVTILGLRI